MSTLISLEKPIKEASNSYSASIIGKPIRIGNLEIAQNDFPVLLNWADAKKACNDLGNGWRLPTKDELNLLYLNKNYIGGFTSKDYISSTEDVNYKYFAWRQRFYDGYQDGYGIFFTYYVRAVRSF